MEQKFSSEAQQEWPPIPPKSPGFSMGVNELVLAGVMLVCGLSMFNSIFFRGFQLGFGVFAGVCLLGSILYLAFSHRYPTAYSGSLLGLSLVILAGFGRADDGFVKFVMLCFLAVSINLGLCLTAGQNQFRPGGVCSLLDGGRAAFTLGIGKLPECLRGAVRALQRSGTPGKRGGAVLLGVIIALPLLAILIPLLIRADAAFDAVVKLLPKWDLRELFITVLLGICPVVWLYCRATALIHCPKPAPAKPARENRVPVLTVNTVLVAVALVYGVYLVSQLAYFSGGFSGILPQGYTMAEYARRGFFEMAWLCAVNLGVISLGVGLTGKGKQAPLFTRLLCLFLGLVTVFLVATASAKMFLYIGGYGLTRLRVLTEVIMLFLGGATLLVILWLFVPRLPYMKGILLMALIMGAAVLWADVDTVVAEYNVRAYETGRLETVDVDYLCGLGEGALPAIRRLMDAPEPKVADQAKAYLQDRIDSRGEMDFRSWYYTRHRWEQIKMDLTEQKR